MKNEQFCPTHDVFFLESKGCQKCNERAAFIARIENAGYERNGTFANEEMRLRLKRSEVLEIGVILRAASHRVAADRRQRIRQLADRLIDPKVGNPTKGKRAGSGRKAVGFVCAHCSIRHGLTQKVRIKPRLNRHGAVSQKPTQHGQLFNYFGIHEWCGLYVADVADKENMYRKDWKGIDYRQMEESEQLRQGKCRKCEVEKNGKIRIGGDG